MEFFHRRAGLPERLGVLPGTFNPVTVAHMALAQAALSKVDEVLFVLPRVFPHKEYTGVDFATRLQILRSAVSGAGPFSVACSEGGLFLEIARDCRAAYGEHVHLAFVCGRDAAERIVDWDYGYPAARTDMLREFNLLVAARQGEYQPPAEVAHAIDRLDMDAAWAPVSASEVRRRIAAGQAWEELVPRAVHELVRSAYCPDLGTRSAHSRQDRR